MSRLGGVHHAPAMIFHQRLPKGVTRRKYYVRPKARRRAMGGKRYVMRFRAD